jgi:hypothetical protein
MDKRNKVIEELRQTEERYSSDLSCFKKHFIDGARSVLDESEFRDIFSSLPSIIDFHEIFSKQLTQSDNVAGLLRKFADFLKIYKDYACNYEQATTNFKEACVRHRSFAEVVQRAEKHSDCRGLSFTSFFIMPVQRIPRYRMLLEQLLKFTEETHEERKDVESALSKISDMATAVNEKMKQTNNLSALAQLSERLKPLAREIAFQPGRIPQLVYLFNDLMFIGGLLVEKKFGFDRSHFLPINNFNISVETRKRSSFVFQPGSMSTLECVPDSQAARFVWQYYDNY